MLFYWHSTVLYDLITQYICLIWNHILFESIYCMFLSPVTIKTLRHCPSQHIPREGATAGPRTAPASKWHVWEDGGCGPRGPNSPGTSPAGGAENQVHAVEGDAELHNDSGFPYRRIQGRLQRAVSFYSNKCLFLWSNHSKISIIKP